MPLDPKIASTIAELERLTVAKEADGMTMREIADQLGLSIAVTRQKVRDAVITGTWKMAGHRNTRRIDGRPDRVPVYRPEKKKR